MLMEWSLPKEKLKKNLETKAMKNGHQCHPLESHDLSHKGKDLNAPQMWVQYKERPEQSIQTKRMKILWKKYSRLVSHGEAMLRNLDQSRLWKKALKSTSAASAALLHTVAPLSRSQTSSGAVPPYNVSISHSYNFSLTSHQIPWTDYWWKGYFAAGVESICHYGWDIKRHQNHLI